VKRVSDHLSDVLGLVEPLKPLDLQLLDAHGCVLSEDVVAPWAMPMFDNSAMDGYAVQRADVAEASADEPVTLPVVADIPAGDTGVHAIGPGLAARIMTGAPVPAGADAVVPVEDTDGGVSSVTIRREPKPEQAIRRRGEDVAEGDVVLQAGTFLGAAQVGLLAAVGRDRVRVRPRPRVVVLSTGSELVDPGLPLQLGQITDSNSYTLAAAAKEAGAVAYRVGAVDDEPRTLLSTLEDQLVRADLVVTSGGISAGAFDVVKQVLSELGTVRFEKVAMQPGMPQGYGVVGEERVPILTLPGNPVSAFVSFEVFVRPAIRRMLGVARLHRPSVRAVLQTALRSPEGKRQFARARVAVGGDGGYVVTPLAGQGSHLIGDLAYANALVVVPEAVTEVAAGQAVDTVLLDRRKG
jgi:molybdopterin molybdotransferase